MNENPYIKAAIYIIVINIILFGWLLLGYRFYQKEVLHVDKDTLVQVTSMKQVDPKKKGPKVTLLSINRQFNLLASNNYTANIENKDGVITEIKIDSSAASEYDKYSGENKMIPINYLTGDPYIRVEIAGSYVNINHKKVNISKTRILNYFEYLELKEKVDKNEPIKYLKLFW